MTEQEWEIYREGFADALVWCLGVLDLEDEDKTRLEAILNA